MSPYELAAPCSMHPLRTRHGSARFKSRASGAVRRAEYSAPTRCKRCCSPSIQFRLNSPCASEIQAVSFCILASGIQASSHHVAWRSNMRETSFRLDQVDHFQLTASTISATLSSSFVGPPGDLRFAHFRLRISFGRRVRATIDAHSHSNSVSLGFRRVIARDEHSREPSRASR
jgi:hypothetical protein